MMKRAFTLIEVNLAILVMAGGILSVIVLYSLGYRETRQSREDIVSTAYSDAILGPLVAALSDRELDWKTFNSIETKPAEGWGGFLDSNGYVKDNTEANDIFGTLGVPLTAPQSSQKSPVTWGLVVYHQKGSGLVKLGFRASRKKEDLLSAPLYYTEVRYQGGFKTGGTP